MIGRVCAFNRSYGAGSNIQIEKSHVNVFMLQDIFRCLHLLSVLALQQGVEFTLRIHEKRLYVNMLHRLFRGLEIVNRLDNVHDINRFLHDVDYVFNGFVCHSFDLAER